MNEKEFIEQNSEVEIKNVFETNELEEISVCAKFAHTAADGKTYNTKFYNLDFLFHFDSLWILLH
ncbi:MAG: hypothetical protein SPL19_05855 [Fibrobacter sp.]|nr:hypothetical protein [Fibrobacter sp.]MDY6368282.1 hypothetical protein [Fibrobacter sp.]MDY6389865.1 hypothetical protein [Fibrobacter sp.]